MDKWTNFEKKLFLDEQLGIAVDCSKVGITDDFIEKMRGKIDAAYSEMEALETGSIANADENRMVGHYWLRNSDIAPTSEIKTKIDESFEKILKFSEKVHLGHVVGQDGNFENALFIGIGGSSLGPQLVCESLIGDDKVNCYFIDNTDADGIDLVLHKLQGNFGKTLVVVTSKSGSTPEPRNAMVEVASAYEKAGYSFSRHAVAITGEGSLLDKQATSDGWIERFAMWDWVGGRTSVCSAVGLLPAALQGKNVKNFLSGAKDIDSVTRTRSEKNPAMMLALSWYLQSNGSGQKDMVVLPYRDRLSNFAKYLQQLIMESIGKEKDRSGNVVHQGLTVYGNKGSTDQHSFVQQLRDGVRNFFVTIINVLESRISESVAVDKDGMTSGDYLNGFALGTIKALSESGTGVIQISINKFSEYELGALIALYERAVGFYASLVNVNAYNQPGVEAGKKAAAEILKLQQLILAFLVENKNKRFSISEIAQKIMRNDDQVLIYKILEHILANNRLVKKFAGDCIAANIYEAY